MSKVFKLTQVATATSTHAELSPSGADRWLICPGSVALTRGMLDKSGVFADEGTDAHELAAECLVTKTDALAHLGRVMGKGNRVSAEMAEYVQNYVDYVRDLVRFTGGVLMIEQKLPIESITGEAKATGTSDIVILTADEIIIIDLKYGRGVVVEALNNSQLQIYGLSALRHFGVAGDFKTVRMVIHQPRLRAVTEWVQTVEQMEAFGARVLTAAAVTRWAEAPLVPSSKGCKFCKAKATCPALRSDVLNMFDNLAPVPAQATGDALGTVLEKAEAIESWLKAIKGEAEARLLSGGAVTGFKVVLGKRGNRAWIDKEAVAGLLLGMRFSHDDIFDYALVSPTDVEKIAKEGRLTAEQWAEVKKEITQSAGRPTVAPQSDKRPAISILDDFDDETLTADAVGTK